MECIVYNDDIGKNKLLQRYKSHIRNRKNNISYFITTQLLLISNFLITADIFFIQPMNIPINISYFIFHIYLLYNINVNTDLFNIFLFYLFGLWSFTFFVKNKLTMDIYPIWFKINIPLVLFYLYTNSKTSIKTAIRDIIIDGPMFSIIDTLTYFNVKYNILDED